VTGEDKTRNDYLSLEWLEMARACIKERRGDAIRVKEMRVEVMRGKGSPVKR